MVEECGKWLLVSGEEWEAEEEGEDGPRPVVGVETGQL